MRSSKTKIVRIISIVLAAVILLSLVSTALIVMVHAASSSEIKSKLADLRAKQAEIQTQSDELEKSIAENKDQTKTLVGQKAEIDQEMEMSRQKIENLNEQIQQLNLLIAEKQTELEASVAKEEALQKQYKARLRSMEETGSVSYWSILFRASSFSDLLDRVDMIREIAESDQLMLKQLSAATQAVETERADLEQQKLDLQQTEDDLAVELAELETKRATAATYGEANGYYVTINHGDGYSSIYAHMTNYVVSVGDSVKQGQLIGYVGTTGWSTGPHLHFEILYNGSNVNPMNYISLP